MIPAREGGVSFRPANSRYKPSTSRQEQVDDGADSPKARDGLSYVEVAEGC